MNFPTVKQLRYYIALVENNHFGKAAESCFVSQSAFSVAIKELEIVINGQLVDRTNKSVTITSLGKEIYTQAKLIIRELSHLLDISQGNDKPLSGKLSLGIIPTIAPFLLPKFMFELQKTYLDLELYLYEGTTLKLYDKLMKGELDVILIALPYSLKNTETLTLFKESFYLAHRKESKWIKKNMSEPSDESVILLEDGHCLREHTLSACKLKNSEQISQYSASSMLTLIEMVKSDVGITFLPEMCLDSNLIKQQPLELKKYTNSYREIGLVWRKGSSQTKEFEMLGNFINGHK
ncbi:MAG TPA: hydrogen peroxide-inducible genes activator [Gammaproteobacteria bacterium]|nr:hydrogen peroxide-inducible genes activator [Xanthomonadales bacterium]HPI96316.1 hydrogen peroxide-inducible genes activator [Gammaproteobacteria bacterium]HPQ87670.1 hydrogen peroxide-inducible genes activator [Gammaproteobacteria bacterium]